MTISPALHQDKIVKDDVPSGPRLRVNRTQDLILSEDWQRIDFNGNSPFNTNTFPRIGDEDSAHRVSWDVVNKLFKINHNQERNYRIEMFWKVVGGVRPSSVQLRFVIPAPTPIYFPFPDTDQYIDLANIESRDAQNGLFPISIYSIEAMREHGVGLDVRVENKALLSNPPKLDELAVIIYGGGI